jgi:hypothetical protein
MIELCALESKVNSGVRGVAEMNVKVLNLNSVVGEYSL